MKPGILVLSKVLITFPIRVKASDGWVVSYWSKVVVILGYMWLYTVKSVTEITNISVVQFSNSCFTLLMCT